jgi:hypothetical protein
MIFLQLLNTKDGVLFQKNKTNLTNNNGDLKMTEHEDFGEEYFL